MAIRIRFAVLLPVAVLALPLGGCVETVVGTAVGATFAVAKGGVHLAGAAVGTTTGAVTGVFRSHGKCYRQDADGHNHKVKC